MAVHDGAWARHISSRLVDLFLILEEAILVKMDVVGDLMVRNPVIAEGWHIVAHARRAMLANSFTSLPIRFGSDGNSRWMLLTDAALMRFVRGAPSEEKRDRLSAKLETEITGERIQITDAICCAEDKPVDELLRVMADQPVLITDGGACNSRLIGIITPFDLL